MIHIKFRKSFKFTPSVEMIRIEVEEASVFTTTGWISFEYLGEVWRVPSDLVQAVVGPKALPKMVEPQTL